MIYNMITNRTEKDYQEAIKIRAEKVQNFKTLTREEIETLEKGMITINTLNRIEQAQTYLKSLIEQMGYRGINISTKEWLPGQKFKQSDFIRILDNTNSLRKAFRRFGYYDKSCKG